MYIPAIGDHILGGILLSISEDGSTGLIAAKNDAGQSVGWEEAKNLCNSYTDGEYSDWRLPSHEELRAMYKDLYLRGKGGFQSGEYWSSTPGYGPHVWRAQSFDSTARSLLWLDGVANSVRPVRSFKVNVSAGTPKSRPPLSDEAYLKSMNLRRSQVTAEERQRLIHACLPVWILAKNEDYCPMPFQAFTKKDIEGTRVTGDGSVDLNPKPNLALYTRTNSKNIWRPDANLITDPKHYEISGHLMSGVAPRSAPTYAFYAEKENGDIWIRYFLFFGYNRAPIAGAVGIFNHYADWVHIGVKLTLQGKHYRPKRYYFSAHGGGKAWAATDPALKFYVRGQSVDSLGDDSVSEDLLGSQLPLHERQFSQLGDMGPFNIGVFLAWGSHECYADVGHQISTDHGPDKTSYGKYCVIPFASDMKADENGNPIRTNASSGYYPVYAWDISDVQEYLPATRPHDYQSPGAYDTSHYMNMCPRQIFPFLQNVDIATNPVPQGHDGDFFNVWMDQAWTFVPGSESVIERGPGLLGQPITTIKTQAHRRDDDMTWRIIGNCGIGAGIPSGPTAKAPPIKMYEWRTEFDN